MQSDRYPIEDFIDAEQLRALTASDVTAAENDGKGLKFDNDKQQWFRLPLVALEPLADVYCKAGKKYPAFNCLLPFENGSERLYDALMRHNAASQIDPMAKDPEDDCYHLAKVAFCALTRLHNALYHSEK